MELPVRLSGRQAGSSAVDYGDAYHFRVFCHLPYAQSRTIRRRIALKTHKPPPVSRSLYACANGYKVLIVWHAWLHMMG